MALDGIVPDWPVPAGIGAFVTTRAGGVSTGCYASLNLGTRVGDDPAAVEENRRRLRLRLPAEPVWLQQVHGSVVVDAATVTGIPEADASFARTAGVICTVQMADCMPVLFATRQGDAVAAAHAGWRGLAGGVLEATLAALSAPPASVLTWLGPAIGPTAFEVGPEVRTAFLATDAGAAIAFQPIGHDKWLADLFTLARRRLTAAGVTAIYGGGLCTHADPARFFSHRRDRVSGRMAATVWIEP
ncbi:MAG: peptidoglycan editing factor PgeF [Burkholderiales bacterium]|nr:peptidoglycan editing factor PgeF [Burkholderiales bacterium]